MKKGLKHYLMVGLKGIAMGAADVVPGVSGGTIAFITGIYEDLLNSIKSFIPAVKEFFKKGTLKERAGRFWTTLNGSFLLSLLLGIGTAMLLLSKLVTNLLKTEPIVVAAFFFGLIIASVFLVYKKVNKWTWLTILMLIIGIGLALLLPESTRIHGPTRIPLWYLFISAAISICAMILPGISGSFVLVLLGSYNAFITAIAELNIVYLLVFALGAAIGLIAFSNVLSWLLNKFHDLTVALLTGFIIGSLNIIWPWKASKYMNLYDGIPYPAPAENVLPNSYAHFTDADPQLTAAILAAIGGLVLVLGIEFLAKALTKK